MIKKYESLKKKVGGRENKGNLGQKEQTPLRKLRIGLADGENDGIISKRSATIGKRIGMTISINKKD